MQVISGIPRSSTLVQVISGIPPSSTLVQVISGTSISAAVSCRNQQERLSPVTGASFPAPGRAPISCQSLRLALTGSDSEALWQQLARRLRAEASQCARTRALFCFLPCRELCRVHYWLRKSSNTSTNVKTDVSYVFPYFRHLKNYKSALSM